MGAAGEQGACSSVIATVVRGALAGGCVSGGATVVHAVCVCVVTPP